MVPPPWFGARRRSTASTFIQNQPAPKQPTPRWCAGDGLFPPPGHSFGRRHWSRCQRAMHPPGVGGGIARRPGAQHRSGGHPRSGEPRHHGHRGTMMARRLITAGSMSAQRRPSAALGETSRCDAIAGRIRAVRPAAHAGHRVAVAPRRCRRPMGVQQGADPRTQPRLAHEVKSVLLATACPRPRSSRRVGEAADDECARQLCDAKHLAAPLAGRGEVSWFGRMVILTRLSKVMPAALSCASRFCRARRLCSTISSGVCRPSSGDLPTDIQRAGGA